MIPIAPMRSNAPFIVEALDDFPPEHWYLSDGFMMPITRDTQRREDVIQGTFDAYVARTRRDASILANVALRWDELHADVGVDPDVMWIEPALPAGMRSVLTWKPGVSPPRVAVEIVSEKTAHKDYTYGPAKYGTSRTRELWVFDPEGYGRTDDRRGPWVLQVWRRVRGEFRRVYAGDGPCFSRELGAWLVVVGDLLRVANDKAGEDLWPTVAETADAEAQRADAEAQRADAEAQRADAEAQRANAEAQRANAEATARAEAERKASAEATARAHAEERLRELEAAMKKLQDAPAPDRARSKKS